MMTCNLFIWKTVTLFCQQNFATWKGENQFMSLLKAYSHYTLQTDCIFGMMMSNEMIWRELSVCRVGFLFFRSQCFKNLHTLAKVCPNVEGWSSIPSLGRLVIKWALSSHLGVFVRLAFSIGYGNKFIRYF